MSNEAYITLDLHGKNAYQAKTSIDAALRRAGGAYAIRVIHGHNRGETIKDMLYNEYATHPKVISIKEGDNPGRSDLILRRL